MERVDGPFVGDQRELVLARSAGSLRPRTVGAQKKNTRRAGSSAVNIEAESEQDLLHAFGKAKAVIWERSIYFCLHVRA